MLIRKENDNHKNRDLAFIVTNFPNKQQTIKTNIKCNNV